jgi:hypothetical protein
MDVFLFAIQGRECDLRNCADLLWSLAARPFRYDPSIVIY